MPLLEARDLHLRLGGDVVLQGVSLTLEPGAHTLLLGPSGAGKSTLLALLAGLRAPDRGAIAFEGQPLPAPRHAARYRLDHLGLVFQEFHLVESLTVRHNLGLIQAACSPDRALPSLPELLDPLGLASKIDHPVRVLSRGERQRVALARAFANAPRLLLADEPTASLDPTHRDATMGHLFALAARLRATALVVSHDRALAASNAFHHRWHLEGGALRAEAGPVGGWGGR